MSCPPDVLKKIRQHCEVLKQSIHHQQWLANWWDGLTVNDKRQFLAMADLDDSSENARRPWHQLTQVHRDKLVNDLKRVYKLLEVLKWA